MAFTSLYGMWQDAHERKALPDEWRHAGSFLHWATKNSYKVHYGYKGEFGPEGCAAAIPVAKSAADELAEKHSLSELKGMAAERSINLGDAKTKKDIAALLMEV